MDPLTADGDIGGNAFPLPGVTAGYTGSYVGAPDPIAASFEGVFRNLAAAIGARLAAEVAPKPTTNPPGTLPAYQPVQWFPILVGVVGAGALVFLVAALVSDQDKKK